jgi:hypothetical protein
VAGWGGQGWKQAVTLRLNMFNSITILMDGNTQAKPCYYKIAGIYRCLHKAAILPYPEPVESNIHTHIMLL